MRDSFDSIFSDVPCVLYTSSYPNSISALALAKRVEIVFSVSVDRSRRRFSNTYSERSGAVIVGRKLEDCQVEQNRHIVPPFARAHRKRNTPGAKENLTL